MLYVRWIEDGLGSLKDIQKNMRSAIIAWQNACWRIQDSATQRVKWFRRRFRLQPININGIIIMPAPWAHGSG